MIIHSEAHSTPRRFSASPNNPAHPVARRVSPSMYENELRHRVVEAKLKRSLARERVLSRQKDDLIRQQDVLNRESEHRLLNGLQLIASLISIQSRATKNAEAAALLTSAADRVASVGRLHRHLHALDHTASFELKQYLKSLCRDLSDMTPCERSRGRVAIKGTELWMPRAKGIPLGFIASELVTNAIKHGAGKLTVELQSTEKGSSLSVSDNGPGLPDGFNPSQTHGLGMKLVLALTKQIGGELQFGPGAKRKGTRFSVLFS